MKDVLTKAYGWLTFGENTTQEKQEQCLKQLHEICQDWYLDESIFSLDDNMLQISYEGDYFPHEDCAQVLAKYISTETKGKFDFIDLEAWTLLRYFLDGEKNAKVLEKKEKVPYARKSSLNHAFENNSYL